ncbi:MAG: hypothetical protein K2W96_03380 [Gemmataceae bacterium]|nr:hypothetical protein [Gemmataceae bacterium]
MERHCLYAPDFSFMARFPTGPMGKPFPGSKPDPDKMLRFIDLKTGKPLHPWTEKLPVPHTATAGDISPDGKTLALIFWRGQPGIFLFDIATGKRLNYPEREGIGTAAAALSPDGRLLAALDPQGLLRQWDTATGKIRRECSVAPSAEARLAWSPDGKTLALASGDGKEGARVRLLDPATGKEKSASPPLGFAAAGLVFSPNGKAIAAWGDLRGPRVWDTVAGTLTEPSDEVAPASVSFSPDGKGLFRAGVGEWAAMAARKLGPATFTEWRSGKALPVPELPDVVIPGVPAGPKRPGKPRPMRPAVVKKGYPSFAAWTLDGSRFLLAGGGRLRTYTANLARLLHDAPISLDETIRTVSADGRFVAVVHRRASSGYIREVATGQQVTGFDVKQRIADLWFAPDGRSLVVAANGTAPIIDLSWPSGTPLLGPADGPGWPRSWDELGHAKAHLADARAWGMAAQPAEAVVYLRERLKPAPKRDPARIAALVRDLDADDGPTRDAAQKALAALGPLAEPELRAASSAEAKRRAAVLLRALDEDTAARRSVRRAVMVLERIATPEARNLLAEVAGGEPLAEATREAREALRRFALPR